MATESTNVSVSWGGTSFDEVVDLSWTYGGGSPRGRSEAAQGSAVWSDQLGSVTVSCLGAANVSSSQYGQRKQLVVTGGGATLTTYAIYESVGVQCALNGVTRYTVTFKILDA